MEIFFDQYQTELKQLGTFPDFDDYGDTRKGY